MNDINKQNSESNVEALIGKFKNHQIGKWVVLVGIFAIALASFTDSLLKVKSFFFSTSEKSKLPVTVTATTKKGNYSGTELEILKVTINNSTDSQFLVTSAKLVGSWVDVTVYPHLFEDPRRRRFKILDPSETPLPEVSENVYVNEWVEQHFYLMEPFEDEDEDEKFLSKKLKKETKYLEVIDDVRENFQHLSTKTEYKVGKIKGYATIDEEVESLETVKAFVPIPQEIELFINSESIALEAKSFGQFTKKIVFDYGLRRGIHVKMRGKCKVVIHTDSGAIFESEHFYFQVWAKEFSNALFIYEGEEGFND